MGSEKLLTMHGCGVVVELLEDVDVEVLLEVEVEDDREVLELLDVEVEVEVLVVTSSQRRLKTPVPASVDPRGHSAAQVPSLRYCRLPQTMHSRLRRQEWQLGVHWQGLPLSVRTPPTQKGTLAPREKLVEVELDVLVDELVEVDVKDEVDEEDEVEVELDELDEVDVELLVDVDVVDSTQRRPKARAPSSV